MPQLETIPVGTEVDAYGDRDEPFVYLIGTPFSRRNLRGGPQHHAYHVYRVVRPLQGYPHIFAPWPFYPSEDDPAEPRPGEKRGGWYLGETIEELIRAGCLVEITGRGGEPVEPTGRRSDVNGGTDQ
ncbi:glycohydrolase toxin TNT-related protein [Thermomonospora cellulosilytica]|uniref:TNT domain-containing protein n=1 Tax=Thermomonospora cellulosilytica TaxID=1411118 RepID=A0A7W3MTW0_9ACTN|nr:glycohydrolase toxin TNT-related protein [Thermomonospora cellulosilytica]MBA9001806.1 hypothetical protein [Thermomonospora cellulosilytica]